MKATFPCIQCALCCRKVNEVETTKHLYDAERGCCRHLDTSTNRCTIYDDRPLYCNVAYMYDTYFNTIMSESEFIQMNLKVCYALNQEQGLIDNCKKLEVLIE